MDNALYYTDEEFTSLCAQIRALKPGGMVLVMDRSLQPAQLQALDNDSNLVIIAGKENSGLSQFYCVALVDDADLALAKCKELIEARGGTDIVVTEPH